MNLSDDSWSSITLATVDEENLKAAVGERGWSWQECAHITANESMARALRSSGVAAISIAELIDVVVWDAMPERYRMPIDAYPRIHALSAASRNAADPPADPAAEALMNWRRTISQRRLTLGIRMDNCLRGHLRSNANDPKIARVLRGSVRELRQTLMFLSSAGFRPDDFVADDALLATSCDAWRALEHQIPESRRVREDLWAPPDTVSSGSGESQGSLRSRLLGTLARVFGDDSGPRNILHHGFYFFTPPQWAMFGLLRAIGASQCFVVHDDGSNRAFEIWRRYFRERWSMPVARSAGAARPLGRAGALVAALEGRTVDPALLATNLSIIRCTNTTEFVRQWNKETTDAPPRGDAPPQLFASTPDDINRILGRMGQTAAPDLAINLAELPVGQFLLALHECIETDVNGSHTAILTAARVVDMAASGFLDGDERSARPSDRSTALKRAMPFFADLRSVDDWCSRADVLYRLVTTEVAQLGAKVADADDVSRIHAAADNELRVVPWCDLTDDEANTVRITIHRIRDLVGEILDEGMRQPDNYLAWVRRRLERGLANLSKRERAEIERKLQDTGLSLEEDLDLDGIKEVVALILGREADLGLDGAPNDGDGPTHAAKDIRFVDALGFQRADRDVHVTNLHDTNFPMSSNPFRWPFTEDKLRPGSGEQISIELFRTRIETAPLEGLYLFWLLMDGVPDDRHLTFSWIAESGGEVRNPSPLLSLLARIQMRDADEVERLAGGVAISGATGANLGKPIHRSKEPGGEASPDPADVVRLVGRAISSLPRVAVASSRACPRRFALQWAMGPTTSFQSPHNQAMLFGNVQGALHRRRRFASLGRAGQRSMIIRLTMDLWRHLTRGQRKSSYFKRGVKDAGRAASWQWIFTLAGKRGAGNVRPVDKAYRAAIADGVDVKPANLIGVPTTALLPRPVNASPSTLRDEDGFHRICDNCPVAPRCAERVYPSMS